MKILSLIKKKKKKKKKKKNSWIIVHLLFLNGVALFAEDNSFFSLLAMFKNSCVQSQYDDWANFVYIFYDFTIFCKFTSTINFQLLYNNQK